MGLNEWCYTADRHNEEFVRETRPLTDYRVLSSRHNSISYLIEWQIQFIDIDMNVQTTSSPTVSG